MKKLKKPKDLEELRKSILAKRDPKKTCISVCGGTGCRALGCMKVFEAFETEIKKNNLEKEVELKMVGCPGFCEIGPLVIIEPKGIFYQKVRIDHVPHIISRTVINGELIDDLLYVDPDTEKKIIFDKDVPFYQKQKRIIIGNNDKIDPEKIEDYIALEGYSALSKALHEMKPEEIINEIKGSGLRGRGGGGFPTGRKWETCRNAESKDGIRYVICNADEGDPGAFMDRGLLEGNPHSVLEGMIIGAFAIGSNQGYVYVRNEYPLALQNIQIAIRQAEEYGLLGDDILGSGFNFQVQVNRGGGAFVCGESTALMASLEGKLGEPRAKYIHTVESGLWNKPSNLNNVETWANVPVIINKGADWYNKIGTEKSKGTKIFS
ncbi:MAG: NAD(P)H-dependent oxidoreductase subunit E, partial [Thermoplasmata archaeon]|nr:NAD(P)H-dependent oxidoreductase subunit E [Thermoplasmata archaeon]